jgi:hypothetical protein
MNLAVVIVVPRKNVLINRKTVAQLLEYDPATTKASSFTPSI